ncbi:beta-ribofuranosylaminobenzene 5'-phosphate synthase family protein [Micromonospora sp. NPDC023644]|uniref:beta-ribofuranosylaminobenzene 5'-phosphate synthase family protein n=1 Tax=Micromonospora sp. NPDC023644 TaxID=3154321 RepID=UPI0033EC83FF
MPTLIAYPRLHLGLLDCGETTSRRFGGLGFAVHGMPLTLSATLGRAGGGAGTHTLTGLFDALDERARQDVHAALDRLADTVPVPPMTLSLDGMPPAHVGLGSKTMLVLAALRVACAAADVRPRPVTLQRLSGRGGASGVGLTTFFRGGFVVDLGHPRRDGLGLRPSSALRPVGVPAVSTRVAMPPSWRVSLALAGGEGLSGAGEVDFFARHTPIPDEEVRAAITLAYHEVVPAVLERDLPVLAKALAALQSVGFKRREVEVQHPATRDLLGRLQGVPGVAAGMSSMGPLLFAIHAAGDRQAPAEVANHVAAVGGSLFGTFGMRNRGYDLHLQP